MDEFEFFIKAINREANPWGLQCFLLTVIGIGTVLSGIMFFEDS